MAAHHLFGFLFILKFLFLLRRHLLHHLLFASEQQVRNLEHVQLTLKTPYNHHSVATAIYRPCAGKH